MNRTLDRLASAACFGLLVFLLVPAAWARVTNSSGAVVPGSVDNEVHIEVFNATRKPLVGLKAVVVETPPGWNPDQALVNDD